MQNVMHAINLDHVLTIILSILAAFGTTFTWLKRMCAKIEMTNLDVEAHKKEIQDIVAEMREVMRVVQEMQKTKE